MPVLPQFQNFRVEAGKGGVIHLVFDMPGRSMNVFTNAAIHEMEAFADWLAQAEVPGVVIRSGKANAFCVGADLGELADAYDMIMATPVAQRDAATVAHFCPIGRGMRKLETAGKPVAVAIHGLALGGGCEFALAAHCRVLTDALDTQIGLPESLVGLLPGGGGTQRLPRLAGIAASLPILLEGARFTAAEALAVGVANLVVPPGDEVAAAEDWVLSRPDPRQPWDRADFDLPAHAEVLAVTAAARAAFLRASGGHYPAELAILDCLERGLPGSMDHGIAEEIDIFKDLVQRLEPRNMIAVGFLGRVDYDRARRKQTLPEGLEALAHSVKTAMAAKVAELGEDLGPGAARFAGIDNTSPGDAAAAAAVSKRLPQWFEAPANDLERAAFSILCAGARAAAAAGGALAPADRPLADYHCAQVAGFPRYLGGPFTFLNRYCGD